MKRLVLTLAIGALAVFSARDARALGPIDIEAGLKAGAATKPSDAGTTPYGVGLGARAGVSLFQVYLGVSGIHYFGSSADVVSPNGARYESSISSTLVGVEAGYTIKAIPLLRLRPQLGVGMARFHYSADLPALPAGTPGLSFPEYQDELYLEPGVTVILPLGLLYVGADANALILPSVGGGSGVDSSTYVSLSLHGQIGVTF